MKFLLLCCLFGTFLATGMCLECPVCLEMGQNCTGFIRTCKENEDTCVTFQTEVIRAPLSVTFTTKACGTSNTCHLDYVESSLHNELRVRSRRACCTGQECQTLPTPVLKAQPDQLNGLQCPACVGLNSVECNEHLVSCRASENQCLSLTGENVAIFNALSFKGCASESMCTVLEKRLWTFDEKLDIKVQCTPALPQSSK